MPMVMQLKYDKKILDTVLNTFIRNKTLVYGEDRVKQKLVLFPKLIKQSVLIFTFLRRLSLLHSL